jgi:predicted ester cyclase
MKAFVTGLRTGFPDIHFTVERQVAEHDLVASRWFIEGTHQGPFLGMPPTGNKIKDQGSIFSVSREGRFSKSG